MNPSVLPAVGWLIRGTFRQARASGLFWLLLALSAGWAGLCLTAELPADWLGTAVWLTDAGLLLALVVTSSLLPSFLEPGSASVLLAKPVPRPVLLLGKCFGVFCLVGFHAAVFLGGTALTLGLRTGEWDGRFWLCLPVFLLHFAVFFSLSALLAVSTRSTTACVFGSAAFWLVCWALSYGRHAAVCFPELQEAGGGFGRTLELAYWALPRPADLHLLLAQGLGALVERGAWHPEASVLVALGFGVAMLTLAAYEFSQAEY